MRGTTRRRAAVRLSAVLVAVTWLTPWSAAAAAPLPVAPAPVAPSPIAANPVAPIAAAFIPVVVPAAAAVEVAVTTTTLPPDTTTSVVPPTTAPPTTTTVPTTTTTGTRPVSTTTVPPTTVPSSTTTPTTPLRRAAASSGTPWVLIALVVVLVVAIAAVLLLLSARRRRGAEASWRRAVLPALGDVRLARESLLSGSAGSEDPQTRGAVDVQVQRAAGALERTVTTAPDPQAGGLASAAAAALRGLAFAIEADRLLRHGPTAPSGVQLAQADEARRARASELDTTVGRLSARVGRGGSPPR